MRLRIIIILIVSSVLAIGALGLVEHNFVDHSRKSNCSVSLLSGADCTSIEGSLALAFHHVSGIQKLTQSTISPDVSLLLLVVLLILASVVVSKIWQEIPTIVPVYHQIYLWVIESSFIPKKYLRWFAFRYKRDPHVLQWVYEVT